VVGISGIGQGSPAQIHFLGLIHVQFRVKAISSEHFQVLHTKMFVTQLLGTLGLELAMKYRTEVRPIELISLVAAVSAQFQVEAESQSGIVPSKPTL